MQRNSLILTATVAAIFLVVGSFFLGYKQGVADQDPMAQVIGVTGTAEGMPAEVDFAPFWKTWLLLEEKFVEPVSTTTVSAGNQEKVYGAISGLVNSLDDPYTVFFPPVEKENFESSISGNFSGVGMEVGIRDNGITVISPLPNSPAKEAGILSGDRVLQIDGQSTAGMSIDEAVNLIRGPKGSPVKLLVQHERSGESEEITIVRDVISIPALETEFLAEEDIFIIRLFNFSAVSPNEFRDALQEFIRMRTDKLIIDLRGNPGGFLEASQSIASWFLPKGEVILREVKSDNGQDERVYRSEGFDVFNDQLKLVILVDGGSASASEILAGALSEHGIATLIGETTFGKGSVQELVNITDDTSLKVTIARWLTPEGNSISENGLEPDIEVPITLEDIEAGIDPQQNRAVEYLLGL